MQRVTFYTLGCKLNFAETGTLRESFEEQQYHVVPFGEAADVAVINTCTVTEEADRKCRQVIRRALKANPDAFIIVTGCYAQLQPEEIASIKGVDVVLGANEKFRLFNLVESFSKKEQTQIEVSCIDEVNHFGPAYNAGDRSRAFLKVQDGCDYTCSFCTIPLARGKSRSQSISNTIEQAHQIASKGYKEIVLSGINIGLFGEDTGESLFSLLTELDTIDGIERFRISSIEPNLLSNQIIDFVAHSNRFQPHFHIPMQSGDDFVLGKMRRRYKRDVYQDRVSYIKNLLPHACIGADVIVGFPAETHERFQNTVHFIKDLPISYLHVFTYSERPDTTIVEQLSQDVFQPVPKNERSKRNKTLRLLSDKKKAAFYLAHKGQTRPVFWERSNKGDKMFGFTDNYIKVEQTFDPKLVHTIQDARLGNLLPSGCLSIVEREYISLI